MGAPNAAEARSKNSAWFELSRVALVATARTANTSCLRHISPIRCSTWQTC